MNEPIKITGTVAVWLPSFNSPADLQVALQRVDIRRVIDMTTLYGDIGKDAFGDYARIGDAEVTITFLSRDEQVAAASAVIRRELELAAIAYAEKRDELMTKLSNLQALEYVEA